MGAVKWDFLDEQHDQLTEKCSDLRIAESASAERSKSLESEVSLLKAELVMHSFAFWLFTNFAIQKCSDEISP